MCVFVPSAGHACRIHGKKLRFDNKPRLEKNRQTMDILMRVCVYGTALFHHSACKKIAQNTKVVQNAFMARHYVTAGNQDEA
jgi:hypothetical protein